MSSNFTLSIVDFSRLVPLVAAPGARVPKGVIDQLDFKLANATLVRPEQIHADVVTMNSKVLISSPVWETPREYSLVYPNGRMCEVGELSILSALGCELLGARIAERFALGQQATSRRMIEVLALTYQPEAAGDWQL